ncbi:MAG TPA: flagellar filament outer layer protein FlaA [Spirochaetota bacterium]
MKRFAFILLVFALSGISFAQKKTEATDTKSPAPTPPAQQQEATDDTNIISDQVYREVTVEDFENVQYTEKNVEITATKDQKAAVAIRDDYPAPIKNSKKYLGVKVHGKSGDWVSIIPPKELAIADHCQSISAWVYGKNFSGELLALVRGADGQVQRFSFGKLNFLGWRKLTLVIPKDFPQEDKYLAQPKNIYIVKLMYNPGRTGRLTETDWDYFYIDDISAKVRKKYVDKQNDAW